ncbi:hypothetical protein ANMWB30_10480 [Arthrobacter sp. MWB30]|nr:hypothetical protein ANMWB30_10480 [Arthrobacter sp. MWB30]
MPAVHRPGSGTDQPIEMNHAFDVECSRTWVQSCGAVHGFSLVAGLPAPLGFRPYRSGP